MRRCGNIESATLRSEDAAILRLAALRFEDVALADVERMTWDRTMLRPGVSEGKEGRGRGHVRVFGGEGEFDGDRFVRVSDGGDADVDGIARQVLARDRGMNRRSTTFWTS